MVTIKSAKLVPYTFVVDPSKDKVDEHKAIPGIDTFRPASRKKVKSEDVPEPIYDLTGCGVEELRYTEQIMGGLTRLQTSVFPKSTMSIQQVEEKYNPRMSLIKGLYVNELGEIAETKGLTDEQIATLKPYTDFPLKGANFYICYLNITLEPIPGKQYNPRQHGIVGTGSIARADQVRVYDRLCDYESKHVIPRLGKSVNRSSFPNGAEMTIKGEDGHRELYKCPETFKGEVCGGVYKANLEGHHVCNKCGMEYSWQADEGNVTKISMFDDLDTRAYESGDFSRMDEHEPIIEDSPEVNVEVSYEESLEHASQFQWGADTNESYVSLGTQNGSLLPSELKTNEARIAAWEKTAEDKLEEIRARNKREYELMLSEAPIDEVRAHKKLHDKVVTSDNLKKQARAPRADRIYERRVAKAKSDSRKGAVLNAIKVAGCTTAKEIRDLIGLQKTALARILESLVKEGKLEAYKLPAKTKGMMTKETYYKVI